MVALGVQRDDLAKYRFRTVSSRVVLGHDAWPDLDFSPEVEDTGEDGATGDTSSQVVDFGSRFVDVKGTDDNEVRVRGEISDRDGDAFHGDGVDVVLQLGRYGHNG